MRMIGPVPVKSAGTASKIVLAVWSIVSCQTCSAPLRHGGPHYYLGWNSYVIPLAPTEPVSQAEAQRLPNYNEVYFDAQGRTVIFTTYANGQPDSRTTYSYGAGRSFEERTCWKGELTVTQYDKDGKETGSQRTEGRCALGRADVDAGRT